MFFDLKRIAILLMTSLGLVGAGDGGLFGMGRDDALLLEFLVGLFGGELFGGFDGVFDGVFGGVSSTLTRTS